MADEKNVNGTPEEEVKEKKTKKEKEPKEPLRHRIGRKLMNDEPLISKGVKRGIAIVGGILATGAAIAIAVITGQQANVDPEVLELPEGIDPEPILEVPATEISDAAEALSEATL